MRRVPDWQIQVCWWISGIFATGAVWYLLSLNRYQWAGLAAYEAVAIALLAIGLHRRNDHVARQESSEIDKPPPFVLSSAPTKDNIERVILDSDAKMDWSKHTDSERSVFSYKHDVNLRFEMLNDDNGVQCEDFREPWANKFPDKSATGYWCDLYYSSTHIARYILVAVDGARALLPIPKRGQSGSRPTEVLPIEYKIAKIHDTLGTLHEYMRGAGLKLYGS